MHTRQAPATSSEFGVEGVVNQRGQLIEDRVEAADQQEAQMAEKDAGGQQKGTRRSEQTDDAPQETESDLKERQEKLNNDVDAILDEIDEVLEENAEEFVRSYIQKGGQ
jgi:ubiquitin-like protein Pup